MEESRDVRMQWTLGRVNRMGASRLCDSKDFTLLDLLPRKNYSAFFLRRRMMIPKNSTARMVQTNRTIFIVLISFPDKSYFG